jgi:hypothetical protein
VEIDSAWETIRENIKISAERNVSYYELKKHKPWFDGGCSKLLDERKQAKLPWLQDPSEINGDNLNNVRREASRHFRNEKREYLNFRTSGRSLLLNQFSKKCDESGCYNYLGISLLSSCGFRHNRSTTDHIFCIRQILEKNWEYNETVH